MDRKLAIRNLELCDILAARTKEFAPVVRHSLEAPEAFVLDFSSANHDLMSIDYRNTRNLSCLIDQELAHSDAQIGIGGYLEKREWYARSGSFAEGKEIRSIHLGVDIWLPAGEAIYSPVHGTIHSFKDNAAFGDYGPTIIVEHTLEAAKFYTLYGHLSRESLDGLSKGKRVLAGQRIGAIGDAPVNGDWPPHLHFQIILDMRGMDGDYPGVAAESRREEFSLLCPDPNLILGSSLLNFSGLRVNGAFAA